MDDGISTWLEGLEQVCVERPFERPTGQDEAAIRVEIGRPGGRWVDLRIDEAFGLG